MRAIGYRNLESGRATLPSGNGCLRLRGVGDVPLNGGRRRGHGSGSLALYAKRTTCQANALSEQPVNQNVLSEQPVKTTCQQKQEFASSSRIWHNFKIKIFLSGPALHTCLAETLGDWHNFSSCSQYCTLSHSRLARPKLNVLMARHEVGILVPLPWMCMAWQVRSLVLYTSNTLLMRTCY